MKDLLSLQALIAQPASMTPLKGHHVLTRMEIVRRILIVIRIRIIGIVRGVGSAEVEEQQF